jgi:hypothetical protein
MRVKIDIKDFLGKRFGKLVILKEVERSYCGKIPARNVLCKCDCGNEIVTGFTSVRNGGSKSCGCSMAEFVSKSKIKHGLCIDKNGHRASVYSTWSKMKSRCLNPKLKDYKYYGGRGIKVCERWLFSIENFLEDMGDKPDKDYSIERVDVNGDYCPENCKWIHRKLQNRNTRTSKYIEYNNKQLLLSEWCKELNLNYSIMRHRVNDLKMDFEDAIKYPKGKKLSKHFKH